MLQSTPGRIANPVANGATYGNQRRRLYIALLILLASISVVILKNQFWSNGDDAAVAEDAPEDTPVAATNPIVSSTPVASTTPAASQPAARQMSPVVPKPIHRGVENAAQHSRVPAVPAQAAQPQVDAAYPLLAGQMAVQGSVLMQALIGADGAVEDLQVLSGPTILVAAAREAVRQWKFKPYYLNGQAVETQARVTVNFKIKVSDSVAKYQVDSVNSNGAL
jgi:TonB family protein